MPDLMLAIAFGLAVTQEATSGMASRCSLPKVPSSTGELSWKDFTKYKDKAVLLLNLTGRWTGWKKNSWSDKDNFLQRFGQVKVNLLAHVAYNRSAPGHGETFHVPTMQEYMTNSAIRHHLQFAFDNYDAYRAFRPVTRPYPEALLQIHNKPLVSLGTKGSGSGGHAHEANWVAQLAGRKVWIVAPPKANGRQWPSFDTHVCELYKNRHALPLGSEVCVAHPGETLYLPDLWYHGTCNLDDFVFGLGGKGFSDHWPRHLYYIQAGNLQAIQKADASGVNVTRGSGSPDFQPALHLAAKVGPISVLKFLMEKRADPHAFDKDGSQVVHKAAEQGPLEVMQWLIQSRISSVSAREKDTKFLPIHSAAFSGHWDKIEWLLSVRARINSGDGMRATPLHLAAGGGHTEFCDRLLVRRANLHAMDVHGRDAAAWAAGLNRDTSLGYLLDKGVKPTGAHLTNAIQHGRYDTTKLLLERRASLHERSLRYGGAAIHIAASTGHIPMVRLLLQSRANPDDKDRQGRTAAEVARTVAAKKNGQKLANYIESHKRRKRPEL